MTSSYALNNPSIDRAFISEGDQFNAYLSLDYGRLDRLYYSIYGYSRTNGWDALTSANSDLTASSDYEGYIEFKDDKALFSTNFVDDGDLEGIENFQIRFYEDENRNNRIYSQNVVLTVADNNTSHIYYTENWNQSFIVRENSYSYNSIGDISGSADGSIVVSTTNPVTASTYSKSGEVFSANNLSTTLPNFRAEGNVTMTADGGAVLSGYTTGPSQSFAHLVKVDSNGKYEWDYKVETGSLTNFVTSAVDSDGNIVAAGRYSPQSTNQIVYKFDSDGTKLWNKELSTSDINSSGSSTTSTSELKIDSSGNIYIISDAQNPGGTHLTSLDVSGDVRWTQRVGDRGFNSHLTIDSEDFVYAIAENGELSKYDSSGQNIWSKNIYGGISANGGGWSGIAANSTGLFVAREVHVPNTEYKLDPMNEIYGGGTHIQDYDSSAMIYYVDSDTGNLINRRSIDLPSSDKYRSGSFKFTSVNDESIGVAYNTYDYTDGKYTEETFVKSLDFQKIIKQQRHQVDGSSAEYLKLGYSIKGDDQTSNPGGGGADGFSPLTNMAVLGPNTLSSNTYFLEITAESLQSGWNLDAADIVLKYNSDVFTEIKASDITLSSKYDTKQGILVDDQKGLIRFAAASLSDLKDSPTTSASDVFASIKLDIDESYFESQFRSPDSNGKFTFDGNPLGFELVANSDETVFSRTFTSDADGKEVDGGAYTNREIKSLGELKGKTKIDENKVNLYQAEIKFEEKDNGLTFGTQRVIGAGQEFTNLVRQGATLTAETTLKNIGNSVAKSLQISDADKVFNAEFKSSRFIKKLYKDETGSDIEIDLSGSVNPVDLKGGFFKNNFDYDNSLQQSVEIEVDMKVTGSAGSIIDVSNGLFKVTASGMDQNPKTDETPVFFESSSGSKNLITFSGDLNYDGRVSMKDLAFLNAGAARQQTDSDNNVDINSVAADVDANFDNKIDINDLAVLDADWGKTLHDGTDKGFLGSSADFTWDSLQTQDGQDLWKNSSFEAQNAIEADSGYIASLDVNPPVAPVSPTQDDESVVPNVGGESSAGE